MGLLRRKSDKDKFVDEVAGIARNELRAKVVVRDDFALELTPPGRSTVTMFLDNVWLEVQGTSAAERAARVRTALLAMNAPERPTTWAQARGALMPAVRSLAWTAAAGDMVLSEPFLPLIETLIAIDSEHAITYVKHEDLQKWDVDLATVTAEARSNLSGHAIPHQRVGHGWAILGPDGYVSSWLTQPDRLAGLAEPTDTVLVFTPSRDLMIVTTTKDPTIEQLQRKMIDAYREQARALSPCPYEVRIDGTIQPWEPPAGSKSAALAGRARRTLELVENQEQAVRLEKQHTESGEDTYVGTYGLSERKDESLWSYTTWGRQITSGLMPKTDSVALLDSESGDPPIVVAWDQLLRLAGRALTPVEGMSPPRWRYTGWPSDAAMRKLTAVATDPTTI